MDILGFLGGVVSGQAKLILEWGTTLLVGGAIYAMVKREVQKFGNNLVLEVNTKITSIDDPDLREIARHAVRYAANRMPNASGSEKLDAAIKAVQDATPNFIISDVQIKELIQNEYEQIKGELEHI